MVDVKNTTRLPSPRLPFEAIADSVLGSDYELSLVLCGDKLSRALNRAYRHKDYPTNVLSFSVSKKTGEVFINLRRLKGFSVGNLFIHGLFHLKGLDHGRRMEEAEAKIRSRFGVK